MSLLHPTMSHLLQSWITLTSSTSLLPESHLQRFNAPFLPSEIEDALFQMSPDKSPGPDDLHAFFFQHFWDIVKK